MYRELDADAHLHMLGLTKDELPDVLVIFGEMSVHQSAKRIASYLENSRFPSPLPGLLRHA